MAGLCAEGGTVVVIARQPGPSDPAGPPWLLSEDEVLRLELPRRCVAVLREHGLRAEAVGLTTDPDELVFRTASGGPLDAANVRRSFRIVVGAAGLEPREWTPRELRHSVVSSLSSSGMPIEEIAHLAGHASSLVTEKVYRKELRPVLKRGAAAMDEIFEA